jgi:hypothetical protein
VLTYNTTTSKWEPNNTNELSHYDLSYSTISTIGTPDDLIGSIMLVEDITFPLELGSVDLNGGFAKVLIAPSNAYTFNVVVEDFITPTTSIIGTITFTAGSRVGTFVIPSQVTVTKGNILQIKAHPTNPVDTTLSGLAVTLRGCYTETTCTV